MDMVEKLEGEIQGLVKEHLTPEEDGTAGTEGDAAEPVEQEETSANESKEDGGTAPAPESEESKAVEGTPEPKVNPWEKRYNDLRPWTTRVSQENAALRNELDAVNKYMTDMQSRQPKESPKAKDMAALLDPLKEEYPDLAEKLIPALDSAIKQQATSQRNEVATLKNELNLLRQKAAAGDTEAFAKVVRDAHKDFETITGDLGFQEWLGKDSPFIPAKMKVAMFRDNDPSSAVRLLNAFKGERGPETDKKRAVKQAAEALAEPKSGGSNPHTLAIKEGKSKFGSLANVMKMDNDEYEKHSAEILADCKAGILR